MNNFEDQFMQSLHDLIGIPMTKMKKYTDQHNNPLNMINHSSVLDLTDKQHEKMDALKSLISGFNHLQEKQSLSKIQIRSSKDAGDFFSGLLSHHRDREYFIAAFLDLNNTIIDTFNVKGIIGECKIAVRDVLKSALKHDAVSIIMAHNHPGNSNEPSKQDIALTQKFINVFKPLDIAVLDHIIVTESDYCSMCEHAYIDFNHISGEADYSPYNISEINEVQSEYSIEESNSYDLER